MKNNIFKMMNNSRLNNLKGDGVSLISLMDKKGGK